jgi:PadR family transcriptional regulator PadR
MRRSRSTRARFIRLLSWSDGWIKGNWETTDSNREAKYYAVTKAGLNALEDETQRWRQMAGVVEKLLTEEP